MVGKRIGYTKDSCIEALLAGNDQALIHKLAGTFYLKTKRFEKAEKEIQKAVELFPFALDGFNMLGMIAHYRYQFKKALKWYDKVLILDKNDLSALTNRAMLYEQMGDKESSFSVKIYQHINLMI